MWLNLLRSPLAALLAVLVLGGCSAVNWNHEPPYRLTQSWGSKGSEHGQLIDPTGIAVSDGEVFVSDARNSRIQVFDTQGHFKRAFGQAQLGRPMNLAIANGKLYVPDYFKDVVHVFTLAGDYQQAVKAQDDLDSPGGVAVYPDGTLLVADTYGQRIVHIDTSGKILATWDGQGIWAGEFSYPTDVALKPGGGFYVADGYNDRVQQFGPGGAFESKWGGPLALNVFGPFKGWFATVTSLAVGPDGSVFATDFYNDRIQKFDADGNFLTAFAPQKDGGVGHTEVAVAVDANGTVFSVNFKANRVEEWRPALGR